MLQYFSFSARKNFNKNVGKRKNIKNIKEYKLEIELFFITLIIYKTEI